VAKAKDVAKKMLAAFPALKKLENYPYIWADPQFLEAEAILNTMLILMRKQGRVERRLRRTRQGCQAVPAWPQDPVTRRARTCSGLL
jgi:hypothetical protein